MFDAHAIRLTYTDGGKRESHAKITMVPVAGPLPAGP